MFLKYSVMLNIILVMLSVTLFYKYDKTVKEVELVKLNCELSITESNNDIIKDNIIELTRIKALQDKQHQKFLEVNDELINTQQKFNADISAVNATNERLLIDAQEARSKAFTTDIKSDNRSEALREYATIREGLHDECKYSLIEVSEDATRLQQKVLEFDKKWDIQSDTILGLSANKKADTSDLVPAQ